LAKTVLILDEAVAFGGSIVSTANLIRGLDPERYRAVFGTATSEAHVKGKLKEAADSCPVLVLKKSLDYAQLSARTRKIDRIGSAFLRKAATYGAYVLRLLQNLPYMVRLALAIRRHKVDLVQLNNGFGNDEGSLVAAFLRKPTLIFFRGYVPMGILERKLFRERAGAFVSVSEYIKSVAVEDGVPADRFVVATPPAIPDPLEPGEGEATRKRYGIPAEAPLVGMFGRIVKWKGQIEFMMAAAKVAEQVPEAHFMIVGDESDGSEDYVKALHGLVRDRGLTDRVHFTGYVDDVDAHYAAVDMVTHASIDPEPSGRVIFEAMVHGIPLVASTLGGPREFIEDGVDGFLVDPDDADTMAERMVTLLTDAGLRAQMGQRARTKILENYGPDHYAEAVMAAYDRCV